MYNQRQEKSIPLAVFFVLQALLIIILASVVFLNAANDKIEPTDYDRQPYISINDIGTQLPDAPTAYIGVIEQLLAKTVELNSENFDIRESNAEIRDGSFNTVQFNQVDGIYYTMIVDIPNLQQSYQIYSLYPLNDENPNPATYYTRFVLCLDDYSEKIYPDFDCKDFFSSDARQAIVSDYLNYFNFEYFTASVNNDDLSLVKINPISHGVDAATKNSYISKTKSAIESLGISPEIFTYKVLQQSDLDYTIPSAYR